MGESRNLLTLKDDRTEYDYRIYSHCKRCVRTIKSQFQYHGYTTSEITKYAKGYLLLICVDGDENRMRYAWDNNNE